jgi:2-polyprenyl-3-methyl-5-hydroxy-6-metoxy-1,4-benzoquinol methylase
VQPILVLGSFFEYEDENEKEVRANFSISFSKLYLNLRNLASPFLTRNGIKGNAMRAILSAGPFSEPFSRLLKFKENNMPMVTPEMEALKTRLKAAWNTGDYGRFATYLEPGALEFLGRIPIKPGVRLLDVACGAGQIAIPAARAGADVTGIDIAPNWIAQAHARAEAEGLTAQFDEGDAEALPYTDDSFDVVVSLFGAMFAPRPQRVAAELVRVCRPGGRIVMGNHTPQGLAGQLFKTIGQYAPPSPLMSPPVLWGDEATVRERFKEGVAELHLTRRLYPYRYPFAPGEVVAFYSETYGPLNRTLAALDADKQRSLRHDLEQLWKAHNLATDGSTACKSEYLEVVAIRA